MKSPLTCIVMCYMFTRNSYDINESFTCCTVKKKLWKMNKINLKNINTTYKFSHAPTHEKTRVGNLTRLIDVTCNYSTCNMDKTPRV